MKDNFSWGLSNDNIILQISLPFLYDVNEFS